MTNLKATKEEHQKRRDDFTNIKKHWKENHIKEENLSNKIYELECQIARYREQITELSNEGHQYYLDNFKKYYPDNCVKIKETDTREEAFKKDEFWRGYNI
tara:strand:- start:309 stop:611 length:303 start_codon:yes stop_codon:yes gene_type:complete